MSIAINSNIIACANATWIDRCNADNKICLENNSTGMSECGKCKAGFIENFVTDDDECVSVEDLNITAFHEKFDDIYYLDGNITDAERKILLIAMAQKVSEHNSQIPPPNFFMGLNSNSAISAEELSAKNGFQPNNTTNYTFAEFLNVTDDGTRALATYPTKIDWKELGAVTPIKNQAACGCCWACATAAILESWAYIQSEMTSKLESYSFQQLTSCDESNNGCKGGNVNEAIDYTNTNAFGGLTTAVEYPFEDQNGQTTQECKVIGKELAVETGAARVVTLYGLPNDINKKVENMKIAVSKGPVAIAVAASCVHFNAYSSGIADDDGGCACTTVECLDHAVTIVGYNDDDDTPYWLIKNSWGTSWGEEGYMRVAQTVSNEKNWGLYGLLAQGSVAESVESTEDPPTPAPTEEPSNMPSNMPSQHPSESPTNTPKPSMEPSESPKPSATPKPSSMPTSTPTSAPTSAPTKSPITPPTPTSASTTTIRPSVSVITTGLVVFVMCIALGW